MILYCRGNDCRNLHDSTSEAQNSQNHEYHSTLSLTVSSLLVAAITGDNRRFHTPIASATRAQLRFPCRRPSRRK